MLDRILPGDWRRLSAIALAILVPIACASLSGNSRPSSSPTESAGSSLAPQSPGPGIAIALRARATVMFHAGGFTRQYQLDSDSNPANDLQLESGQAFLDLGSSNDQELRVTVVGSGAPGATLKGADQVLAFFTDEVARVGGIATVGQGTCTLALTRFGTTGMAGNLDCEDVAPLMGASGPVDFQASFDAVPG